MDTNVENLLKIANLAIGVINFAVKNKQKIYLCLIFLQKLIYSGTKKIRLFAAQKLSTKYKQRKKKKTRRK